MNKCLIPHALIIACAICAAHTYAMHDPLKPLIKKKNEKPNQPDSFLGEKIRQLASQVGIKLSDHNSCATEQSSKNSSPRESMHIEEIKFDSAILQNYAQRTSSVLIERSHKKLLIRAIADRSTFQDFICPRKNAFWNSLHNNEEKKIKLLRHLSHSIAGKVDIELDDPKKSCCIFTSCQITTIALNDQANQVAIAGYHTDQHQLLIYAIQANGSCERKQLFSAPHLPLLLAFSPSGQRILMCCLRDQIVGTPIPIARVLCLQTGSFITELEGFEELKRIEKLQCGWTTENEIIAFDGESNGFKWNVPLESASE